MRWLYRLHPEEYCLAELEQFYTEMAAQGWLLVKRGTTFSKFRKAAPQKRQYRVILQASHAEVAGPVPEEAAPAPGWELVTDHGFIRIYSADAAAPSPDFTLTQPQTKAVMHSIRKSSLVNLLVLLLVIVWLCTALGMTSDARPHRALAQLYLAALSHTGAFLLLTVFSLSALCSLLASFRWEKIRKQLRQQLPTGLAAPKHWKVWKRLAAGLICICLLLTGWSWLLVEKSPLPTQTDAPYLLLRDAGFFGDRTPSPYNNEESQVVQYRTPLCSYWDSREFLAEPGKDHWMYQDVYQLHVPFLVDGTAQALLYNGIFANSPTAFTEVTIPGLDHAYVADRLECVAVKDNLVIYITMPFYDLDAGVELLMHLSAHWQTLGT